LHVTLQQEAWIEAEKERKEQDNEGADATAGHPS
jgi:hypothetical protein